VTSRPTGWALLAATAVVASGCVIFPRRLEQPPGDQAAVLVLSNRLGGPLRRIARHAYLAIREKGKTTWDIWECCPGGRHRSDAKDPFVPSFGDEVRLHGVFTGPRAERMIACIPKADEEYGNPAYWLWPGPNSNTYVEAILRKCAIHADLQSTAVGKDFRGIIGVSWTSGGTGFQIETPLLGLKIGLTEGIEIHIFGLSFGIDLWPPAIIVPVGEGRIGFGDR
jgi:hypothetical protein